MSHTATHVKYTSVPCGAVRGASPRRGPCDAPVAGGAAGGAGTWRLVKMRDARSQI